MRRKLDLDFHYQRKREAKGYRELYPDTEEYKQMMLWVIDERNEIKNQDLHPFIKKYFPQLQA